MGRHFSLPKIWPLRNICKRNLNKAEAKRASGKKWLLDKPEWENNQGKMNERKGENVKKS